MEIKATIESFYENAKERLTNPFLGTFMIIWIIKNYRFCFAVFNFDKDQNLEAKLNFIKNEFPLNRFCANTINTILLTFLVLIVTYLLLTLSRFITDFYIKVALPWVINVFDGKRIFTNEQFENIEIVNSELLIKLKEEKIKRREAESERNDAEKELASLKEMENIFPSITDIKTNKRFQLSKTLLNKVYEDRVIINALENFVNGISSSELNNNRLLEQLHRAGYAVKQNDGNYRISEEGMKFIDFFK